MLREIKTIIFVGARLWLGPHLWVMELLDFYFLLAHRRSLNLPYPKIYSTTVMKNHLNKRWVNIKKKKKVHFMQCLHIIPRVKAALGGNPLQGHWNLPTQYSPSSVAPLIQPIQWFPARTNQGDEASSFQNKVALWLTKEKGFMPCSLFPGRTRPTHTGFISPGARMVSHGPATLSGPVRETFRGGRQAWQIGN